MEFVFGKKVLAFIVLVPFQTEKSAQNTHDQVTVSMDLKRTDVQKVSVIGAETSRSSWQISLLAFNVLKRNHCPENA